MSASLAVQVRALAIRCRNRADRLEADIRDAEGSPESPAVQRVQAIVDTYRAFALELDALLETASRRREYAQTET